MTLVPVTRALHIIAGVIWAGFVIVTVTMGELP